jgi:hypothetical protein
MTDREIQDVPAAASGERAHILGRDCWCKPKVTPVTGGLTVVHRKSKTAPKDT